MRYAECRVVLLWIAALFAAAAPASAETIVVKPSTLTATGWKTAIQAPEGKTAAYKFVKGLGTPPAGSGSLNMRVSSADTDPLPKVYMGTNNFSGVKLAKITQFRLWICPRWNDYRGAQPATVELAATDGGNTRLFTFLPWGIEPSGYFGRRKWREHDLMKAGGAWELTNVDVAKRKGDWQWVLSNYADSWIATPPAADWEHGTLPGTGVNIKIGAGKAVGPTEGRAWWRESCGCNAYVDRLTIGYLNDAGQEVVKTYDFEAD